LIEILRGEGVNWDEQDLAKLHGPTGLDIGAETPEEIAISIVAEMQAVLMRRAGGALQYRSAPIHDPVELAKVRT
jgi:xanthine/CO dehydrogenase XdhC/CoxF family maturation factor